MAGLTRPRPLQAGDDRQTFDCGRDALNHWFKIHAWRNQVSNASRTSVVFDIASGALAGYVSLCAARVERGHLPKSAQRNQPDPLPAVLLGQLAVDVKFQGRGVARDLMFFALTTAMRVSASLGSFGVITHPLDDGVRRFYEKFGFAALPFDPLQSMFVRTADLLASGFETGEVL
jgi:predicted N-acetyltransferase YhbS